MKDASPAQESPHWAQIATRWAHTGPPLRPSPDDLAEYRRAVAKFAGDRPVKALVLGSTPEFREAPWPPGSDVVAVDRSAAMLGALWKGTGLQGDWRSLPLADGTRDVALCDGGLHLLNPAGQAQLVCELARVLRPGGIAVFRVFSPPREREEPGAVLDDLLHRRVSSLNALKMRLGMAMQRDIQAGVALDELWNAVHDAAPDFDALAATLGWTLDHIHAIDTYRNCLDTYHFVTIDAAVALFTQQPGGFAVENIHTPDYELGERCPIVTFRRRD